MTESTTRSPSPLHAFNMILVTVCVTFRRGDHHADRPDLGRGPGDITVRAFATVGIAASRASSASWSDRRAAPPAHAALDLLARPWPCIAVGSVVGWVAIWINENNDDILLKTIATIFVLFVASTIGTVARRHAGQRRHSIERVKQALIRSAWPGAASRIATSRELGRTGAVGLRNGECRRAVRRGRCPVRCGPHAASTGPGVRGTRHRTLTGSLSQARGVFGDPPSPGSGCRLASSPDRTVRTIRRFRHHRLVRPEPFPATHGVSDGWSKQLDATRPSTDQGDPPVRTTGVACLVALWSSAISSASAGKARTVIRGGVEGPLPSIMSV